MALGPILLVAAGIGVYALTRARRDRGAKRKKLEAVCAEIVQWTREEQNDFVRNVVRPEFDRLLAEEQSGAAGWRGAGGFDNWPSDIGHEFMVELFAGVTAPGCNPAENRAAYKVIWCATMFWFLPDEDLDDLLEACEDPAYDPWFQETGQ